MKGHNRINNCSRSSKEQLKEYLNGIDIIDKVDISRDEKSPIYFCATTTHGLKNACVVRANKFSDVEKWLEQCMQKVNKTVSVDDVVGVKHWVYFGQSDVSVVVDIYKMTDRYYKSIFMMA